jgi:hypothetical protein
MIRTEFMCPCEQVLFVGYVSDDTTFQELARLIDGPPCRRCGRPCGDMVHTWTVQFATVFATYSEVPEKLHGWRFASAGFGSAVLAPARVAPREPPRKEVVQYTVGGVTRRRVVSRGPRVWKGEPW